MVKKLTNLLGNLGTEGMTKLTRQVNGLFQIQSSFCILRENTGTYQQKGEWVKLVIPNIPPSRIAYYQQFKKGDRLSLRGEEIILELRDGTLKRRFIAKTVFDARTKNNYVQNHSLDVGTAKQKIKHRQNKSWRFDF